MFGFINNLISAYKEISYDIQMSKVREVTKNVILSVEIDRSFMVGFVQHHIAFKLNVNNCDRSSIFMFAFVVSYLKHIFNTVGADRAERYKKIIMAQSILRMIADDHDLFCDIARKYIAMINMHNASLNEDVEPVNPDKLHDFIMSLADNADQIFEDEE